MTRYAHDLKKTPQSEPVPGKEMVQNSAGGYAFAIDDFARLDRFLILGNEGGTYYAKERKLTLQNAACVIRCLEADAARTIDRIVTISDSGRAPKNTPAIFALALAFVSKNPSAKVLASQAINKICRIGTHLFQLVESLDGLRGWGRGLRKAVGSWYTEKEPAALAYQLIKYQSREKWSHGDVLNLCHVASGTPEHEALFRWAVQADLGIREVKRYKPGEKAESFRTDQYANVSENLPGIVQAFEKAKHATDAKELLPLIADYNLPRECIPTQFLTDAGVWEALLERMPATAMLRNLATMTRVGLLTPLSEAMSKIRSRLTDVEFLRKGRIHPLSLLVALKTYAQGHGERGGNTWEPLQPIVDSLDSAFYLAFGAIEPSNKNWLIGLDISGSMDGGRIAGMVGITPRIASAALSLVTVATEPNTHLIGFTSGSQWGHTDITPIKFSAKDRLDRVIQIMAGLPMGGTDCSLPMRYASAQKIPVDTFAVFTDNETWAGDMHPFKALQEYRQKMGRPAKLVVNGMTATEFSIADPNDGGMLDCVGMDASTPALMTDFARDH